MRHIVYNSKIDLEDVLKDVNGRYRFRNFLFWFFAFFLFFENIPLDIVFTESNLISEVLYSLCVSLLGNHVTMNISRSSAKKKLVGLAESLEKEDVHVLEEDLEKAVVSKLDDKMSSDNEVISYFLVLDMKKQLRVLEGIRTDLSSDRRNYQDYSLYVLHDEDVSKIVIPEKEIAKLGLKKKNM